MWKILVPPHCNVCSLASLICLFPGDNGKLQWTGNWVTFLDTMLQMMVVGLPGRSLRLPTRIRSVCIDPAAHLDKVCKYTDEIQGVFNCYVQTWSFSVLIWCLNPMKPYWQKPMDHKQVSLEKGWVTATIKASDTWNTLIWKKMKGKTTINSWGVRMESNRSGFFFRWSFYIY